MENSYHPLFFKKSPATLPTTYVSPYCKMHGPREPVLWHLPQLVGPCCCSPIPGPPSPTALWGWLSGALPGAVLEVLGEVTLLHPSSIHTEQQRENPRSSVPRTSPAGLAPWLQRCPVVPAHLSTSFSFLLLPASPPVGLLPGRQHVPQSCLRRAPRRCKLTS